MLNFYKSTINSIINYYTLRAKPKKKNSDLVQRVQNHGIRFAMGYIISTPISTIFAESCLLPFEFQDVFFSVKFILKQLYLHSDISAESYKTFFINKFCDNISLTPKFNFNPYHYSIKNMKIIIKTFYNEDSIEKRIKSYECINEYIDSDFFIIFCDGCKSSSSNCIVVEIFCCYGSLSPSPL